jgi:23S rRNA (adenine2503-C2)-methyltransferase
MDNLPRSLRQLLAEEYRLQTATITQVTVSPSEPTRKYLFTLVDGSQVEAVSMLAGDRHTVCLSSQAGCNAGCGFCATAALGLRRSLTTGEMMDQLLLVQQEREIKATNVVFMGMGEPFLNYAAVLAAADIMHHPQGLDLGSRRITISTAGVAPKIERFTTEERPYRLAISLNATNDDVRSRLMPINNTWPLERLMAAARNYCTIAGQKITFEYVLLAGINDSPDDARRLLKLLHGCRAKINVIPYNEIGGPYRRPDEVTVENFATQLRRGAFPVIIRQSNGVDITAGCGQLALGAA